MEGGNKPTSKEVRGAQAKRELEAESKRIWDRVQEQMAENRKRSEAYLNRARNQIRDNEAMIRSLKVLDEKIDAAWAPLGLKVGQYGGTNPFLVLEEADPNAFAGLRESVERMNRDMLEYVRSLGIDYTPPEKGSASVEKAKGSELGDVISSLVEKKSDVESDQPQRKKVARMGRL